jgi:hypothetical protein
MRVFSGITSYADARKTDALSVTGPPGLTRDLPHWFAWSPFAPAVRERLSAARP